MKLLASVGWRREDVFITNVVKCRPPDNRDPQPDEIAACAPFLRRQLEVLDPALVVTLGRYSMGTFMPGARISQAHGTVRPVDPATGAGDALALRDVPPGGRTALDRGGAAELRRHGGGARGRCCSRANGGRSTRGRPRRRRSRTPRWWPRARAVAVAPEPVAIAVAVAVEDVPRPCHSKPSHSPTSTTTPHRRPSLAEPAPLPVAILVTGSLSPASDLQPDPGPTN